MSLPAVSLVTKAQDCLPQSDERFVVVAGLETVLGDRNGFSQYCSSGLNLDSFIINGGGNQPEPLTVAETHQPGEVTPDNDPDKTMRGVLQGERV
uniref:Uncharacterized protein n=1 Tax=Anopheles merus TaxID=30066 RepID=A0A182V6S3_ANOME